MKPPDMGYIKFVAFVVGSKNLVAMSTGYPIQKQVKDGDIIKIKNLTL